MNRNPSAESLARLTKFERFLIVNKKKLMWASFLFAFLVGVAMTPQPSGIRQGPQSARMQVSHQLGVILFAYAQDHGGKYPVGRSSTEVFQQLIDQGYVTDPGIFYFATPGKSKATTNKLKPENVCYDITNGVLPDDPDTLPIVFSTGYKIEYIRGGKAQLLPNGDPSGIAVYFKGNEAIFLNSGEGGIPLFSSSFWPQPYTPFDPKGRTYQQLTPEGQLP